MVPVTFALVLVFAALYLVQLRLSAAELSTLHERAGLSARAARTALGSFEFGDRDSSIRLWHDVVAPLCTHQLFHAGALPALINAVFLWVFGSRIESRIGSLRFLLFHGTAGVVAGSVLIGLHDGTSARVIGASGAVAASIGAHFALHWRSRIVMVVPVVCWPVLVELSVVTLIVAFAVLQVRPVQTLLTLGDAAAHPFTTPLSGFLLGIAAAPLLVLGRPGGARRSARRAPGRGRAAAVRSRRRRA